MSTSASQSPHRHDFEFEVPYAGWVTEIGPPLVQVELASGSDRIIIPGCVDTGSFAVIADAKFVEPLGIDPYAGPETPVGGTVGRYGTPLKGYLHDLLVGIPAIGFNALVSVVVVPSFRLDYILLGRQGFLNVWKVCFREKYQTMYFSAE
jgi:hypothetical protein